MGDRYRTRVALVAGVAAATALFAQVPDVGAQPVGQVNTNFRWFGPDDRVVVDGFDDPKVDGVSCWISRARTGGVKGAVGLAEDPSDASIACRQVGPISLKAKIKDGDVVFDERRSALFKTMQVVRFLDQKRNALIYLVYSDKLLKGSPKNSLSAVPIMPWSGAVAHLDQQPGG